MRYRLLMSSFFILLAIGTFAGVRSKEDMKAAALNVLMKNSAARSAGKRGTSTDLKEYVTKEKLSIMGSDDLGFAVVTSDDRFEEVIGYSSSTFSGEMPCGFKWWLEMVEASIETGNERTVATSRACTSSLSNNVAPLLTTAWGQTRPYYDNCTFLNNGNTYQCVTGCVATAMAQVMNYYQYPQKGVGSNSYDVKYNNSFTITYAEDFSKSKYDWSNMLDDYSSYKYNQISDVHTIAVAKLMKDCGVSVNTSYSDETHGSSATLPRVETALKTYFSYDTTTKYYERSDYDEEIWKNIIYNEIRSHHPIIYRGSTGNSINSSGHAFVLHGYDTSGNVYINWGWNGYCDGYYNIGMLNPNNSQYNYNQAMVIAIPGTNSNSTYTLSITSTGSGQVTYSGNTIANTTKSYTINAGSSVSLTYTPNSGYRVKSVKVNNVDVTSSVSNNKYTISNVNKNTTISITFEAIPVTTYTLSITSAGSGYVTYSGNTISGTTKSYTFNQGASLTLSLTPNSGYRVKSVYVNDVNITSSISDNTYTINNVSQNTTINVTFEAISSSKYTIKVNSHDNYGCSVIGGMNVRNGTHEFSVEQGSKFTINAIPDNGYRVAKIVRQQEGYISYTSTYTDDSSQNHEYSLYNIKGNYTVDVYFENIPIEKPKYTIKVCSHGDYGYSENGSVSVRNRTQEFSVEEGSKFTINAIPDNGYRVAKIVQQQEGFISHTSTYTDDSSQNHEYSLYNIKGNHTIDVYFEELPFIQGTYTLSGDDIQGNTGTKVTLPIILKNSTDVKLCQFDLRLPNGVTVVTKSNGKLDASLTQRAANHSISSKRLSNGDYRFVISSLDSDAFTGNDGALVEITLDIPSGMAAGEYTVKVLNVELSVPNGNDLRVVKPSDTESKLTVSSYKPGDVNNDGSVSVTDVGCIINYILEQVPSTFVFAAADMNNDGEVSVTDVGIIINKILSGEASSRSSSPSARSFSEEMILTELADGYQLKLEDMGSFIGFQCDVEGATVDEIMLLGGSDHKLACRQLSNGKYRVVCYSPTNSTFIPQGTSSRIDNALLKLSSAENVTISNIRLTTTSLDELHPTALSGTKTGITTVEKVLQISVQGRTLHISSDREATIPVYSLDGSVYRILDVHRGENNYDDLRAGVYMINNLKIILR